MTSSSIITCFLAIFMVFVLNATPLAAAEEFKVGDAQGWRQPPANHSFMYNLWASRRKFHVGDSLRFVYKNDSVLVVEKWGYYHCNSSRPISVFNNGNSVVALDKPGEAYFISGDPDRCKDGQRLMIDVLPLHPPSPPAPAKPEPKPRPSCSPPMPPAASPSPTSSSEARVFGASVLVGVFSVIVVTISLA